MASGTVNTGGSSMPGSNPVKVIKATPKNIQPATNSSPNPAPVPGTSESTGAPNVAPSQTIIQTGKGPTPKGLGGHSDGGGLAAPPAAHLQTGPTIATPSVDYNTQQGSRIPADIMVAQHEIIVGEQDQQLQDKAGA